MSTQDPNNTTVRRAPRVFTDKFGNAILITLLDKQRHTRMLAEMYCAFEPKHHYDGLPPCSEDSCTQWVNHMITTGVNLIALSFDQGVVGHAALFAMESNMCEMLVFVSPPNQRGGIGTRLIYTIIQLAYELGHEKIWLSVGPGNFVAQHLYTKCGFTYLMNRQVDRVEMMLDLQQYHQAARVKVSDVMKADVISINKDVSCEEAMDAFLHHNVGSLPVVDNEGELFGMLYQTNLIIATNVHRPVHEVATFEIPVLHQNASLDSAIRLFQDPGIRCIPVLNAEGKLRGIVGRKDILAYYASAPLYRKG